MPKSKNPQCALIVFAKRPHLGQGKQRLAANIGVEKAYVIAQLLLEKTVETVNNWKGPLIISPSSASDTDWATELCTRAVIVVPQNEGTLGERLEQVDREVRMLGLTQCIYIGTDAPLLSIKDINTVKKALEVDDQVYFPATDGGVVLMASNSPWKSLQTVTWSTKKVCLELKSLAKKQGLSVRLMNKFSDMDDIQSLTEIRAKLNKLKKFTPALSHLNTILKEI